MRSDNSRYQIEPTRGRGYRDRPFNSSSTSRQPSQQLYQPPADRVVSYNEQVLTK